MSGKLHDVSELFNREFTGWSHGQHGVALLEPLEWERQGELVCRLCWRGDGAGDERYWAEISIGVPALSERGETLCMDAVRGENAMVDLDYLGAPRFSRDEEPGPLCWITGDLHADMARECRLAGHNWPAAATLTEDDYVIVCGDFGYVWDCDEKHGDDLDWFEGKPWTTLFVDGDHEDHAALGAYPVERWHGGLTHVIRPNVRHLMRGQVFEDIAGARILAMGGASSYDRGLREPGVDWWPQELPDEKDFEECRRNLDACGWKVDYVVTHEAPADVAERLSKLRGRTFDTANGGDRHQRFLKELQYRLEYKRWYFGHYHYDRDVEDAKDMTVLFRRVLRLGESFEDGL